MSDSGQGCEPNFLRCLVDELTRGPDYIFFGKANQSTQAQPVQAAYKIVPEKETTTRKSVGTVNTR